MRIALLGYGRMGKMIEQIAVERGHEIVLRADVDNRLEQIIEQLKQADVAIEFSIPTAAVDHYKQCFDVGVPVVSGTTGWLTFWDEVVAYCQQKEGGFFYASNFSIGVNLFFQLNRYLARLMNRFDYQVSLEETHHIHKLDAPSGTAITLAEGILEHQKQLKSWKLVDEMKEQSDVLPIVAKRIGEVPGIHSIWYKSNVDEIEIRHAAFSREGFALGAVLAAEFMYGKKGVFGMQDMLNLAVM